MTDAQKGESLRHFARELNRLLVNQQQQQQQSFYDDNNNSKASRSHRRSLQQDPVFEKDPPKRTCGQVIGVASREEVLSLVDGIWSIVNPTDNLLASVTSTSILYGLQARVVCGSCAQVYQTYAGAPFLSAANSTQSNAFARFCGPTRFAHNTTFSSLVLTPINATTQEPLHARLKSVLAGVGINNPMQKVGSETYPSDFSIFQNQSEIASRLNTLVDIFVPLIIGGTGAVTVVPDYVGYGQSYRTPKSLAVKQSYQRVGTTVWLETMRTLNEGSGGCTVLEPSLTVGGISEGGYAAVAWTLALVDMGFDVLSAHIGAGPLRLEHQVAYVVERFDNQTGTDFLRYLVPHVVNAFSSTNADLVNTNQGQDFGNQLWLNPNNQSHNVIEWMATDQTTASLVALLPPDPLDVINPNIRQLFRDANAQNLLTPCDLNVTGQTDLLCQAMVDNNLIADIESTPVPTMTCYSPQDDVISYGNQPNSSKSDLLTEFTFFGTPPSGNHGQTTIFCFFGILAPFTSILRPPGYRVPNTVEPLTDPNLCQASTASPTSTPTTNPTTSSPSAPTPLGTPFPTLAATPAPTSSAFRAGVVTLVGAVLSIVCLALT